jgi:hypothetical protein
VATEPDWQMLYVQIGRLLETAPVMSSYQSLKSPQVMQWVGRAHALIHQAHIGISAAEFNAAVSRFPLSTWETGVQEVFTILYRVMAHCELQSPSAVSGTFVPVGNAFDAFAAVGKLLKPATKDVLIVDPYLDESILIDFGAAVPAGIPLRLLADPAFVKPGLEPAAKKWVEQHGPARPLAVRLTPAKTLHDRAIFIDGTTAWTLTQSIKDLAKRSPAEIIRADDIAALKIPAYEAIWAQATDLL